MYDDIIKRHKPRGWTIEFKQPGNARGQFYEPVIKGWCRGIVIFDNKILRCVEITDRSTLATFLHECGHVNLKHGKDDYYYEHAQCEYEAENYAIKVMRAYGIPVPRRYLMLAKAYVDDCIRKHPEVPQTEEVLKFAYGRKWREHS